MDENPADSPHSDDADAATEWIKRNLNWLLLGFAIVFIVLPRVSPWDGLNDNLNVFSRVSEWVLGQVERLFKNYGYYVVFLGVLLENSMFLGLLVPGAIILILAGLSAENGSINIWLVLGLAFAATVIGDTISYMIGRYAWTSRLQRSGLGQLVERVREPMHSNSTWLILGYHLAGYSRVIGPAAAGIFRIPFRRWAPLDYTGGAIWVLLYTVAGVLLGVAGVEFGDTKRMVRIIEFFFLGLLIAGIMFGFARSARSGGGGPSRPATLIVPIDAKD